MSHHAGLPLTPATFRMYVKVVKQRYSLAAWLLDLFNPPVRSSLTFKQKINRALLVTVTLVTLSIFGALAVTLGVYAFEFGTNYLLKTPNLVSALKILACSIVVNAGCIAVLFQVKRFDQRLFHPDGEGLPAAK